MTEQKKAGKRFNRFFVIILIIAALTAVLTFTTNQIAREKEAVQDSTIVVTDTIPSH